MARMLYAYSFVFMVFRTSLRLFYDHILVKCIFIKCYHIDLLLFNFVSVSLKMTQKA